jgi:hypothetical protein
VEELGFKGAWTYFQKSAVWDDHEVVPGSDLVAPKDIPNSPLRAVPDNGSTQFFGGGNAQSSTIEVVLQNKQRRGLHSDPTARVVDTLKIFPPENTFCAVEGAGPTRF